MKTILQIYISLLFIFSATNSIAAVYKTFDQPGQYDVDMGTTHYAGVFHDFASLTFPKKSNQAVEVVELYNNLAYCDFEVVQEETKAIVGVTFDVENDGGFNSCTLLVAAGLNYYEVTLGAEVGE